MSGELAQHRRHPVLMLRLRPPRRPTAMSGELAQHRRHPVLILRTGRRTRTAQQRLRTGPVDTTHIHRRSRGLPYLLGHMPQRPYSQQSAAYRLSSPRRATSLRQVILSMCWAACSFCHTHHLTGTTRSHPKSGRRCRRAPHKCGKRRQLMHMVALPKRPRPFEATNGTRTDGTPSRRLGRRFRNRSDDKRSD